MRDVLITLFVFGSLPFILKRPYIGVLMWVWISVMNPHRLSWGFAYDMPFAAVIAAVTLLSLVMTKEPKKLPLTPPIWMLLAFTGWMAVTTVFAFRTSDSADMLNRVLKIMLMTFVTIMLIRDKKQINLLIWTLVASLGFYGVKGGIFTVMSGGSDRVWGPSGSFIEGNNEVALGLIVIIPIIYYLFLVSSNKWLKRALVASMLLCGLAALGSYSRGALLAIGAMAFFLWLKSPQKVVLGMLMALIIPAVVAFMPSKWSERMDTINTYKEDGSAMGRINAWSMAFNLAKDRPLVGGGFEIYDARTFATYAPVPEDIHAAHSIYFQAMGEHGFVGLGLYLAFGFLTWRRGSWIIKNAKSRRDLAWAVSLATMIQVSMIGFAVGGAFLSLLYFDVPYYLMGTMTILGCLVERSLKEGEPPAETAAPQAQAQPAAHAARVRA